MSYDRFEKLSSANQKKYIREVRKAFLEFETQFAKKDKTQFVKKTISLFLNFAWAADDSAGAECIIGGRVRLKVGGLCPTRGGDPEGKCTTSFQGDAGFRCGKIYGDRCIQRVTGEGIDDISPRCYEESLKYELITKEEYGKIRDELIDYTTTKPPKGICKPEDLKDLRIFKDGQYTEVELNKDTPACSLFYTQMRKLEQLYYPDSKLATAVSLDVSVVVDSSGSGGRDSNDSDGAAPAKSAAEPTFVCSGSHPKYKYVSSKNSKTNECEDPQFYKSDSPTNLYNATEMATGESCDSGKLVILNISMETVSPQLLSFCKITNSRGVIYVATNKIQEQYSEISVSSTDNPQDATCSFAILNDERFSDRTECVDARPAAAAPQAPSSSSSGDAPK